MSAQYHQSPNIFHSNVDPTYPQVFGKVNWELEYFSKYIRTLIDKLDVKDYRLTWTHIEDFRYAIHRCSKIHVEKPKKKIQVNVSDFDPEINLTIERSQKALKYLRYDRTKNGIILTLPDSTDVQSDDSLYYGTKKADFSFISKGADEDLRGLTDGAGKTYRVLSLVSDGEYLIIDLASDHQLPKNSKLYLGEVLVNYSEQHPVQKQQVLSDKNGILSVTIKNDICTAERKIEGTVSDSEGFVYHCSRKEERKGTSDIWISVEVPDKASLASGDDDVNIIDIFFSLVSEDMEIWEKPRFEKGSSIKVKKIYSDEQKILVDRLPNTPVIYPSGNKSQLFKQSFAVETLKNYPTSEHRNLLKVFENRQNAWATPTPEGNEIKWEFLKSPPGEEIREGTEEQRRFVEKSLNTPDFAILEGPPGSGKTTAITELIYQLIRRKKRILLCASTHVAIDNVLMKLIDHYAGQQGLEEHGIVPLRIGREESDDPTKKRGGISEDTLQFMLKKRGTKFEKIFQNLPWFIALSDREKEHYIQEAAIHSSNLVCGTTIGVLQYPHFQQDKGTDSEGKSGKTQKRFIKPEFDYLIIDETSKTTFPEFLVPAVHAKKWVLVGDIRQLAPQVAELHVRMNLENILENRSLERALSLFMNLVFNRKGRFPPKYICVEDNTVIQNVAEIFDAKYEEELGKKRRIPDTIIISDNIKSTADNLLIIPSVDVCNRAIELFCADLIFIDSRIYSSVGQYLPANHILLTKDSSNEDQDPLLYRSRHWANFCESIHFTPHEFGKGNTLTIDLLEIRDSTLSEINEPWSKQISWRMKRVHELDSNIGCKQDKPSSDYYSASMHALLPPDKETHRKILGNIRRISNVAFPSVLISLQEGVKKYVQKGEDETVMSHGLPEHAKKERHEKLTFQHRMHPDISRVAKEIFYDGKALLDVKNIISLSEGGYGERDWEGRGPEHWKAGRFLWRDIKKGRDRRSPQNVNEDEINAALEELEIFIRYLKDTDWGGRGDPSKWEIMIITFYDAQRAAIGQEIRRRYTDNRGITRFNIEGVPVYCYNVDKVQGREADVAILSMVRNSKVGFMDCPNRLNVAITRAKFQTVILGDHEFFRLKQHNSIELKMIAERAILLKPSTRIQSSAGA